MADEETSDRDLPQPARLWTVDEANARIEGMTELLAQLRSWVVRFRKVAEELERLTSFWGKEVDAPDHPDAELRRRLQEESRALTKNVETEVARLRGEGIEVKDLEDGLVDFYSVHNGEVVFLCWQKGEGDIEFYHTLEGGYRNRRPLPDHPARAPARSHHRAA